MFAMVFECFLQVFQIHVSSVSSVFFCILQLLHMDVSKLDRVLHKGCAWEAAGGMGDIRDDTCDVGGWRGPAVGALAHKPDALGCSLARSAGTI
jgi:hypothetical protein